MIESKWTNKGYSTEFHRPENFSDLETLKTNRPYLSLTNIELVGISDDSINITYNGVPSDTICTIFGVDIGSHTFCDYYALEIYADGSEILKIYDQDLSKHPLPSLPKGARLDPLKSGIGIYYPDSRLAKIYFLHDNPETVHKWWGSKNPPEQISRLTYFGVEFDRETLITTDISQYSIYKDEDLG